MNVVSCAPSSATNTAISSAGSVMLALAETRWGRPAAEERLADLEGLDRTAAELRADLALGDVGGDRARMAMRAGNPPGP